MMADSSDSEPVVRWRKRKRLSAQSQLDVSESESSESTAKRLRLREISQSLLIEKLSPSRNGREQLLAIELDEFAFGEHVERYDEYRLVEMSKLCRPTKDKFFLEGTVKVDDQKYIIKMIFSGSEICSEVYNYNDMRFYVKTKFGSGNPLHYILKRPAQRYNGHFQLYKWTTELGIYVIDFLMTYSNVTIWDFRRNFVKYLEHKFKDSEDFWVWRATAGVADFRQHIIDNKLYLQNEAFSQTNSAKMERHRLWSMICSGDLCHAKKYPYRKTEPTVVTPYVVKAFSKTYFKDYFKVCRPPKARVCPVLGTPEPNFTDDDIPNAEINVGDVVGIEPDGTDVTEWQHDTSTTWFAYVHALAYDKCGRKYLRVFWLYEPSHTILCSSHYPWSNELFFSNHCNCAVGKERRIYASDAHKVNIKLFAQTPTSTGYFIRQTYVIPYPHDEGDNSIQDDDGGNEYSFVKLTPEHLTCRQSKHTSRSFSLTNPHEVTPNGMSHNVKHPKLKALDLFCGAGIFSAAFKEILDVCWFIDCDREAVHSVIANLEGPTEQRVYFGSAVEYLRSAFKRDPNPLIAKQGEVDVCLIGCPCVSVSNLQPNRMSENSKRKASLFGLAVAYVDFYRPKYIILENVEGMLRPCEQNAGQNVALQTLSALVGLGYQARLELVDAWTQGSAQQRTRIFFVCSLPGWSPMERLSPTHSTPGTTKSRALGTAPNGLKHGQRTTTTRPLQPYTTAEQATSDLPPLGDGAIASIAFPSHRLVKPLNRLQREILAFIPPIGPGSPAHKACFREARARGKIPRALLREMREKRPGWFLEGAHPFRRVDPAGLFPTIVTTCDPGNTRCGRILHWAESRPLSLMEARRAQSIPDDYVLVGSVAAQWRLVGNAVDFRVATALAQRLGEAIARSQAVNVTPLCSLPRREEVPNNTTDGVRLASRDELTQNTPDTRTPSYVSSELIVISDSEEED